MLTAFAITASAQQLKTGVTAGMNVNSPSGMDNLSSHIGFDIGVKAELGLPSVANGLYVDLGVMLSLKGVKSEDKYYDYPAPRLDLGDNSSTGEKYKYSYNTYYLNIPLHVGYKFSVSDNISMFAAAGPYVGIGLFGKLNATGCMSGTKTTLSDNVYSDKLAGRFDWGLGCRIGVEFAEHYQLYVGYDHGFKNLNTDKNRMNRKNRTFNVSVAYMF